MGEDALGVLSDLLKINPKFVFNYIKNKEYVNYDDFHLFHLLNLVFIHLKKNGFNINFTKEDYQNFYIFVFNEINLIDYTQMKDFILLMLKNMTVERLIKQ